MTCYHISIFYLKTYTIPEGYLRTLEINSTRTARGPACLGQGWCKYLLLSLQRYCFFPVRASPLFRCPMLIPPLGSSGPGAR